MTQKILLQPKDVISEKLNNHVTNLKDAIHGAAHDMSSPLTVLKSYIQFLNMIENEDKKLEILEKMTEASTRLETVIKGLVELADTCQFEKKEARSLSFKKTVEKTVYNIIYDLDIKNTKIQTDFSACEDIYFDQTLLEKVIYQVLKNAIQYSAENPSPTVHISTRLVNNQVFLEIKDNGCGIDTIKEEQNLFKPFKRLTNMGNGRGIGLVLVKNIVERNGGSIDIESQIGQGTLVKIALVPYKLEGIVSKDFKI